MMKKVFMFCAASLLVLALCACGSANTPEAVATKAIKCIVDKDYKGYVDLMNFKEEKTAEEKQQLVALVQDKMDKELEKKEGIKDFSVGQAEVQEDRAVVPYTVNYGNGESKDDKMKLVSVDGKWLIDSGK